MSVYLATPLSSSLSQLVVLIEAQNQAMMALQRGSTEPTVKPTGTLWWNTSTGFIQQFGGIGWSDLLKPGVMHLPIDGSVALTGDLAMGTHKLTGLAAGSAAGHSVRYEQVVLITGANAFAADQSMGGFKLTNLGAPSSSTDAVRKGYVDSALANLTKILHVTEPDLQTSGTDVINDLGFVPRRVIVKIYGDVEIAAGYLENEVDREFEAVFWETESGKGFTAGDEWLSPLQTGTGGGFGDWRLRLTRVDGSTKGLKIEVIRDSTGERGFVLEYDTGGSDPGVVQILAFG